MCMTKGPRAGRGANAPGGAAVRSSVAGPPRGGAPPRCPAATGSRWVLRRVPRCRALLPGSREPGAAALPQEAAKEAKRCGGAAPLPRAGPTPAPERAGASAAIPTFAQTRAACSVTAKENLRLGSPRGHSTLMRGAWSSFAVAAGRDSISSHLPQHTTTQRCGTHRVFPTSHSHAQVPPNTTPREKQDWPRGLSPEGRGNAPHQVSSNCGQRGAPWEGAPGLLTPWGSGTQTQLAA